MELRASRGGGHIDALSVSLFLTRPVEGGARKKGRPKARPPAAGGDYADLSASAQRD